MRKKNRVETDLEPTCAEDLESTMQRCLHNMQVFTLMTTRQTDHSCYDILSVTRVDSQSPYSCRSLRPVIDTQVIRISKQAEAPDSGDQNPLAPPKSG